MNIVFHIGWHKTGTTSIQEFLRQNTPALIDTHQTYYPEEGLLQCAHHHVAWTFQNKKESAWGEVPDVARGGVAYIESAIAKAKSKSCSRVIFSSEEFCTFNIEHIRSLYKAVAGFADTIRIVGYIRRQDLLTESAYNMDVKWWAVRRKDEFDEYVRGKEFYPDYYKILKGWAEVFGKDSLAVRCYERATLVGRDVRTDFCHAVGLDCGGLVLVQGDTNDSLGPRTLEFLRVVNGLDIERASHGYIVDRLLAFDAVSRSPRCVLFEPYQRRAFMQRFNEFNDQLSHLGIDPQPLVLSDQPLPERNVRRLNEVEFGEIWEYVGRESVAGRLSSR